MFSALTIASQLFLGYCNVLDTVPQANLDDSPSHNSFSIAAFDSVVVLIKIKLSAVNLPEIELQNLGTGLALVR